MPLETLYITGVPGATEVSDPKLAYSEVMHLKREGKMLVETTDTPTGKRFRHNAAASKINVDVDIPIQRGMPGPSDPDDLGTPEEFIIIVKY